MLQVTVIAWWSSLLLFLQHDLIKLQGLLC